MNPDTEISLQSSDIGLDTPLAPKNNPLLISFGTGKEVAVNTTIGTRTLKQWVSSIQLEKNILMAPALQLRFNILYEFTT